MADELDVLLERVDDEALRRDLAAHIAKLRQKRQFGLVFEEHLPELVALPQHEIRRGTKVVGRSGDASEEPRVVRELSDGMATLAGDAGGQEIVPVAGLVAVAAFGEPIYPGLRRLGSIDRGGNKPAHVVIKGENYHALEALQFTHAGQVDCIYIDPPYNTGARDWKYNNDYVDATDRFPHSKWLAFIKRRLVLARRLLTADGTLVVTIDEHEVNQLGLLLQQVYPDARIQLVTIVMNTAGSTSPGQFSRAEEYAFFCRFGEARAVPMPTDLLSGSSAPPQVWFPFHRSRGLNDTPSQRPNLVYPIAVDAISGRVSAIGRTLAERVAYGEVRGDLDQWEPDPSETLGGDPVVWPVLDSGEMSVWQANPDGLQALLNDGFFRVRKPRIDDGPRAYTFAYVKAGNRRKVLDGTFKTTGREPCGARMIDSVAQDKVVKTVWKVPEHDARRYGTTMLRSLVGNTTFNYPKSPYAVLDTLRTVVGNSPKAVILDFFAGSGTTLQAAAMLNATDGGERLVILVTNNEVDGTTADQLARQGLMPGDAEYEQAGIYHAVTRPRVEACFIGTLADGEPIVGEYQDGSLISEGFDENVAFVELEYLDAESVQLDRAFAAVAPLLWMRAGSLGPILSESLDRAGKRKPYLMSGYYAVLFNPDRWRIFVENLAGTVSHVFVVTDSASVFTNVAAELPEGVEVIRLYENYLSTFAINTGTAAP